MQYRKNLLSVCLLPVLLVAGCGSGKHSVQIGSSLSQSSSEKGENKMPTKSPMLNEILSIDKKDIPRWKLIDVSHIVSKYLSLGSSKEQVINSLNRMHQDYHEEGENIHAGYFKQNLPFVPTPRVFIMLRFNNIGYLEKIDATLNCVE